MKKILVVLLLATLTGSLAFAHMGEKHEGDHGESMENHMEKMKILHSSMARFNIIMDTIFHSIIFSNFKGLEKSAKELKETASALTGTTPHKNLASLDTYGERIKVLQKATIGFEESIKKNDPTEITESFGNVLGACVRCHISFRD